MTMLPEQVVMERRSAMEYNQLHAPINTPGSRMLNDTMFEESN